MTQGIYFAPAGCINSVEREPGWYVAGDPPLGPYETEAEAAVADAAGAMIAARKNTAEEPAAPQYAVGQTVGYIDRHGRTQRGEVLAIEASWRRPGRPPLVVYTVRRPTYAGRRFHCTSIDAGFRP